MGRPCRQGPLDNSDQLRQVKRFDQVVERPAPNRRDGGLQVPERRHHHHGHTRQGRCEAIHQRQSIETGQPHVENYQFGTIPRRNLFTGRFATPRNRDRVATIPQRLLNRPADGRFVIDHQDLAHGSDPGDVWGERAAAAPDAMARAAPA
jgi:hypothetical protein